MVDRNNLDRTICFCHSVSLGEILAAIQKGASTLNQLQDETLAATGCGGCECELQELLEDAEEFPSPAVQNTSNPNASSIALKPKL